MKKAGLWLATLLAFVLGVCCLVACGDSAKEGTYKFRSMSMTTEGVSVDIKAGESYMGVTISEDYMTLELKADGTAVFKGMGETTNGTWKVNDSDKDKIDLTMEEGETQTVSCKDGTITMEQEGAKIVLKK